MGYSPMGQSQKTLATVNDGGVSIIYSHITKDIIENLYKHLYPYWDFKIIISSTSSLPLVPGLHIPGCRVYF